MPPVVSSSAVGDNFILPPVQPAQPAVGPLFRRPFAAQRGPLAVLSCACTPCAPVSCEPTSGQSLAACPTVSAPQCQPSRSSGSPVNPPARSWTTSGRRCRPPIFLRLLRTPYPPLRRRGRLHPTPHEKRWLYAHRRHVDCGLEPPNPTKPFVLAFAESLAASSPSSHHLSLPPPHFNLHIPSSSTKTSGRTHKTTFLSIKALTPPPQLFPDSVCCRFAPLFWSRAPIPPKLGPYCPS